ncbi:secretogranin-2a [Nerophis ophidion]|uniref:secretogranin-2a n=1 Tax=Nerophis ophidion TaxID=159077 RepID=UPI002AE0A547|nr:secretogranin-2a [Nerophis ophidion]
MLSFTRANTSLLILAQLLAVLLCLLRPIHGGSLRDHRLRGSESDPLRAPNSDMLKALEYIESLRQRADSQEVSLPAEDGMDDAKKMRPMLRLNEGEDKDEESEDKSEELLQAVLSTLQQTEKASNPALLHPSSKGGGQVKDGGQKQQNIKPHKKMPLMFEDEEEGEGDDEEEDEHESPFKRTNENVEEKYTPQNLATLQSIFDELDKFTTEKTARKRQDEEDEDLFNLRNVYDDEGEDVADWGPMEDQGDEEEEEDDEGKHEFDRSLDYVDNGNEEEEEEDGSYPVKRSTDPDEVDYYLLKVLERTEEEEQKRAIEEEEKERAERGVAQYRDNIDPQVIYQIIQISQKYQIPPLDLLDMLKTGQQSSSKPWQTSSKNLHKIPQLLHRRPSFRQSSPKNLRTEEILNILGLGSDRNRGQAPIRKPYRISPSRLHTLTAGNAAPTQQRFPSGKSADYNGASADQLAAYLAAQMLARYPVPAYRYSQKRDEATAQSVTGSFEQAMQDYLDQMDTGKEDKRQTEDGQDNDAVMKLMNYLNPESEDSENGAKTAQGMKTKV